MLGGIKRRFYLYIRLIGPSRTPTKTSMTVAEKNQKKNFPVKEKYISRRESQNCEATCLSPQEENVNSTYLGELKYY